MTLLERRRAMMRNKQPQEPQHYVLVAQNGRVTPITIPVTSGNLVRIRWTNVLRTINPRTYVWEVSEGATTVGGSTLMSTYPSILVDQVPDGETTVTITSTGNITIGGALTVQNSMMYVDSVEIWIV